nr:MAG TPA: hypothetical protein [Caudoviricetes sp.]
MDVYLIRICFFLSESLGDQSQRLRIKLFACVLVRSNASYG